MKGGGGDKSIRQSALAIAVLFNALFLGVCLTASRNWIQPASWEPSQNPAIGIPETVTVAAGIQLRLKVLGRVRLAI